MTNLSVQKDTDNKTINPSRGGADLYRVFRNLLTWDPFADMLPNVARGTSDFLPSFDIKETKEAFVFKADVPGIKPADLDLHVNQNRLSISGKRESEKTDKGETYYSSERSYGSFTRTFTLPEGIDAERIKAELKDGVLSVELPKVPEAQPKKIAVKSL